jgi:PAS domain S-box-containing protein
MKDGASQNTPEAGALVSLPQAAPLAGLARTNLMAFDLEHKITEWTAGAERAFGWTSEEAVGREADLLLQTEYPGTAQEVRAALTKNGQWAGKVIRYTKAGQPVFMSLRWTTLRDEQGKPAGILEACHDTRIGTQGDVLFARASLLDSPSIAQPPIQKDAASPALGPVENAPDHSRLLIEAMGVCVNETDVIGFRILRANRKMCEFTGYPENELLAKSIPELTHPEDWRREYARMQKLLAGEIKEFSLDKRFIRKNGEIRWGRLTATVIRNEEGRAVRRVSVVQDIHQSRIEREERTRSESKLRAALGETKRYEVLIEGQLEALEQICSERPLTVVLDLFVRLLETVSIGRMVGSILLLDADGLRLRHGAAPSLPAAYNSALEGQEIGEAAGCCGTAAYRRELVSARDIETDPRWQNYQPLARMLVAECGLRACWSFPILSADNKVLGTFALYSGSPEDPDPRDVEVVSVLARTVAVAIQKKRGDQALAESEERLKTLADNISQFAWMADSRGWIFWYNRRWFDYTGTTLEAMQGWGWKTVHHPDHVDRVVAKIQQCWDTGQPWEDAFPLRGKNGQYRWFLSRAVPIRDAAGKVLRWFGTNTDITELREAQQALEESESRFRLIADACPALIWLSTEDGKRTWFNRAWLDFIGLETDTQIGGGWIQHIHPDDRAHCLESYLAAFRSGIPWELKYRLRRSDGMYRWMRARAVPANAPSGDCKEFVGCCIDVTETHLKTVELEELIARRTAKLKQNFEELEGLTYGIIHDLRAPLRAMHHYCRYLHDECEPQLPPAGKDYVARILRSSARMDHLVRDVLTYGQVLQKDLPLESVDVARLVLGILESYPEFLDSKADVQIQGRLPIVIANEAGLTQCLSNLLRNAIKFVAPGIVPRVRVRAEPANDVNRIRLVIEDNGIGIPKQHWDRIFLIFQRLGATGEGTGIGLALVKKSAERMGAKVGLDSEPGKGSRFWIELPQADPVVTVNQS